MRIFTGIAVRTKVAGGVVLTLVSGCGLATAAGVGDKATARARENARANAETVVSRIVQDHVYKAEDYAHSAGQVPQTEVMRVDGTTRNEGDGVTLIIRVQGTAERTGENGQPGEPVVVKVCFKLLYDREVHDALQGEVECPSTEPLAVAVDPKLPGGIDEALRAALTASGSDEAAVRRAVDGLTMPDGIARDVTSSNGVVGVALRASRYDCVMARVIAGTVQVWRPSRIQLAPGEGSCTAGSAVGGMGQTPPH